MRRALVSAGAAQAVFLVLFSYAFFFEGFTDLTIAIGAVITLFMLMQMTARVSWDDMFAGKQQRGAAMPAAADSAPAPIVCHVIVPVVTRQPIEFVDLTAALSRLVAGLGVHEGVLTVQTRHTTTGLMINEHEPLLLSDLQAMFERLVPSSAAYSHDDFNRRTVNLGPRERRNGHAHCRAALLRTSESVLVVEGRLSLGRWQRVFLVEFDGGQRREVSVAISGTVRR
jgi:secondary thiamine-phosphate synthase enzyme